MHKNPKDLERFQSNNMETEEIIAFLSHLDKCDFCLEQMIYHEETKGSIATPAYMKEQILTKAAAPDVKVSRAVSASSRKIQFFYDSLRTAVGVAAALFLLFGIGQMDFTAIRNQPAVHTEVSREPRETPGNGYLYDFSRGLGKGLSDGTDKLTGYLSDFSNKLVNGGK